MSAENPKTVPDRISSPKLVPFLDAHDERDPRGGDPELKRSLVVLGPQVYAGHRFAAVDLAGNPAKSVPLNKEAEYDPDQLRIEVTAVS